MVKAVARALFFLHLGCIITIYDAGAEYLARREVLRLFPESFDIGSTLE